MSDMCLHMSGCIGGIVVEYYPTKNDELRTLEELHENWVNP